MFWYLIQELIVEVIKERVSVRIVGQIVDARSACFGGDR